MESVSSLFCPELSIIEQTILEQALPERSKCQDVPVAGALSRPLLNQKTPMGYKIPIFKAKKYNVLPRHPAATTKPVKSLSQASRISSIRHIPMNILSNNTLSSVQTIGLTTSYPCSPYLIVMMYNKHQVVEYTDEYTRKKAKYLWLRSKLDEINQIKTPIHTKLKPQVKQVDDKEVGLVTAALERLRTQVYNPRVSTKAISKIVKRRKKPGWPKGRPRGPRFNPSTIILSNK